MSRQRVRSGQTTPFTTATVRIFFQRYPGSNHSESGIPHVNYSFRVNGELVTTGSTGTHGEILLQFDPRQAAELEVFGTRYRITVRDDIEDVQSVEGLQRRLNMLGYDAGSVTGVLGRRTDQGILEFQADHDIDPTGRQSARTVRLLVDHAGV